MNLPSFRRTARPLVTFIGLVVIAIAIAYAWGATGHKIINRTAVRHLPAEMASLAADSAFFEAHASDADIRRNNSDTSFYAEWERHFIDIDDYPDFHNLPHDLNTVIALYGWDRVKRNSINPWATAWLVDTLTNQLRNNDLPNAMQTMADLGHYIGDGHQPLHATKFYNVNGVHSRYESSMVNAHQAEIVIAPDSARYIADPLGFAFDYLYVSNSFVDSINHTDLYAQTLTGSTSSTAYYDAMWARLGGFTKDQFQSASVAVASLWYTAWVNAGLSSDVHDALAAMPSSVRLKQNYPNPFNPTTRFVVENSEIAWARFSVYDVLGHEVAVLFNGTLTPGTHDISWDASGQASGIYLYVLRSGSHTQTGKMVLMR